MTRQLYHLANIRDLLINAYDDQDLRRLCRDVPEFRPVYDELAHNTGRVAIADKLIEYADKTLQLDTLLALAKKQRPARYEQHGPYTYTASTFPPHKKVSDQAKRLAARIRSFRPWRKSRRTGCILLFPVLLLLLIAVGAVLWQQVIAKAMIVTQYQAYERYFSGAFLWWANLSGVNLKDANLNRANLSKANLSGANLEASNLIDADLSGANLTRAHLRGAKLRNANLLQANLSKAHLDWADLGGSDLFNADLRGADLSGVDLIGANLKGAYLHNAILDDNTEVDEKWRWVCEIVQSDSAGWSLPSVPDLDWANLSEAQLPGAYLPSAHLNSANLSGANLSGAYLERADLGNANLRGALLREAFLIGANLYQADLTGADLTGAKVADTQLSRAASLQGATMPDGTVHP